jgi:hypothetical protein
MQYTLVSINGYPRAMLVEMVYGEAWKPYVYRALGPLAARLLSSLVPVEVKTWLSSRWEIQRAFFWNVWEYPWAAEYFAALLVMWASLVGFALALRWLLRVWFSPRTSSLAALAALVGLPLFFRYYGYLYDFPTLALFTLALALMARERWRAFAVVFVFCTLSKETSILLTLVYGILALPALLQPGAARREALLLLAWQVATFALIKGALAVIYAENEGTLVEYTLAHNQWVLEQAWRTGMWLPALAVLALGAWLLFARWREKPRFLRAAVWMLAPMLALGLFYGYLDEWRIYYEFYPVALALAMWTVRETFRLPAPFVHKKEQTVVE